MKGTATSSRDSSAGGSGAGCETMPSTRDTSVKHTSPLASTWTVATSPSSASFLLITLWCTSMSFTAANPDLAVSRNDGLGAGGTVLNVRSVFDEVEQRVTVDRIVVAGDEWV